jgi:hypothetical protein
MLASRDTWGVAAATAFARRIAYIYGLGKIDDVDRQTGQEVWSVGWNWRLLRACAAPAAPRAAAEHVLDRVCHFARTLPIDQ